MKAAQFCECTENHLIVHFESTICDNKTVLYKRSFSKPSTSVMGGVGLMQGWGQRDIVNW